MIQGWFVEGHVGWEKASFFLGPILSVFWRHKNLVQFRFLKTVKTQKWERLCVCVCVCVSVCITFFIPSFLVLRMTKCLQKVPTLCAPTGKYICDSLHALCIVGWGRWNNNDSSQFHSISFSFCGDGIELIRAFCRNYECSTKAGVKKQERTERKWWRLSNNCSCEEIKNSCLQTRKITSLKKKKDFSDNKRETFQAQEGLKIYLESMGKWKHNLTSEQAIPSKQPSHPTDLRELTAIDLQWVFVLYKIYLKDTKPDTSFVFVETSSGHCEDKNFCVGSWHRPIFGSFVSMTSTTQTSCTLQALLPDEGIYRVTLVAKTNTNLHIYSFHFFDFVQTKGEKTKMWRTGMIQSLFVSRFFQEAWNKTVSCVFSLNQWNQQSLLHCNCRMAVQKSVGFMRQKCKWIPFAFQKKKIQLECMLQVSFTL